MAENSLYPAFILFDYLSVHAPHKMIIPTRAWSPTGGSTGYGGFVSWDDADRDAKGMIDDLVALLKVMFLATTSFKLATIYTLASAEADPQPVKAYSMSVAGTTTSTGWDKATQRTYSFRTTAYGRYKLVLLDTPTNDTFGQVVTLTDDEAAIVSELEDVSNAWAGRDGARIMTYVSESITLNKRLRREYRMV